jgi:hypothetical protein
MMKKTLLLLALTVSVLGFSKGTFAVETDSTATTGGGRVICETKGEWIGLVSGQFLHEIQANLIKGRESTARPVVLLDPESKGKEEGWDGYRSGSFDSWRPNR